MNTTTTCVLIGLGAAAGFVAGATLMRPGATEARAADELRAEVASLRGELAASRTETRAAEERAAKAMRPRAAPETPKPEAAHATPSVPRAAADPRAEASEAVPRIASGRYSAVLAKTDWNTVGRHFQSMLELLGDAGRAIESGTRPDPRIDQRVETHAMGVLGALAAFAEEAPGPGVSRVFAHPAFIANAIASGLASTASPLTEDQRAALERLTLRWLDDDAARVARYDASTLELRKAVDDGALRAAFVTASLELLTPGQRVAVSPPAFRDRIDGDLVSIGFFWRDRSTRLTYADASAFVTEAAAQLTASFGLRDDQAPALRATLDRFVASLPPAWFDGPDDALTVRGSPRASVTAELARRETEFLESLPNTLGLDAAQRESVRAHAGTWRLVRTPAK